MKKLFQLNKLLQIEISSRFAWCTIAALARGNVTESNNNTLHNFDSLKNSDNNGAQIIIATITNNPMMIFSQNIEDSKSLLITFL